MKTAATLIQTCAALAVVATTFSSIADARQMHAEINYARYLEEKEAVADELDAWMKKYSDDAEIHGWLPQAESRDADEVAEDRKQRFFMAKELVKELKEQNPDAEFSTDSPFSLLTTAEFSAYVKNSYLEGGGRRLRETADEDIKQIKPRTNSPSSEGNGPARPFKFSDFISKWWSSAQSSSQSTEAEVGGEASTSQMSQGSFSFQDLIDWINSNYRPSGQPSNAPPSAPSTRPRPTPPPAPVTTAPSAPVTSAPVTSAPVTSAPVTSAPATSAPSTTAPATSAPRPTAAPATKPPTRAPVVAPTDSPSRPVGPVAPVDTPGAAKNEDVVIGGDGTGVDWSTNKCMPPVQNQGQCGSCWSFATIAGTETGKCLATKASSYVKLSEQQLATCDTRNRGCQGGATVYAFQYIQQNGVCSGADVPYTMSNGRQGSCNTGCTKVASGIKSTAKVQGETGLVSALNTHPVVIAVAAGNAAWKQYKSGVMSTCQTTQVDHAVLAVGYDATTFKIRNSWGANWGEGGYVRMKRDSGSTGTCSMYRDMIHANF